MNYTGNTLSGVINVGGISRVEYPPYEGDYEVNPLTTSQVLETKNKVMMKDMTVLGISYQEVSNSAGGRTVTIAKE